MPHVLNSALFPSPSYQLVTVGIKHIKFWERKGAGFKSKRGVFGTVGKLDTMLCCGFNKAGEAFTGGAGGFIHA